MGKFGIYDTDIDKDLEILENQLAQEELANVPNTKIKKNTVKEKVVV